MAYTSKYKFAEIEAILDASDSTGKAVDIKLDGLFENALQEKNVKVSGDTEIVPDAGYLGMKKVNVSIASEEESIASPKDVNFRDYDGTILHSYTKDEFLALNEFPPLPTQKGLICQEWNWDIAEAKEYVSEYGVLEVGATYITDDGKTRLYIRIAAEGRQNVPLYFSQTIANGVTIDWGDGSDTQTLGGTIMTRTTHKYNAIGDYIITLDAADGCSFELGWDSSAYCVLGTAQNEGLVYCNMLQRVEMGKGITSIENLAFQNCHSLASIVIPKNVTSIGKYAFQTCYSLASIVIPKNVTSVEQSAFQTCYSLASIVIPKNVTSVEQSAFYYCYSLASIVIPKNVTSVGDYAFYYCYGMAFYDFREALSVPTLGTSVFYNIASNCKIVVPDALYDEWIAATNWSTYASKIVKASEYNG